MLNRFNLFPRKNNQTLVHKKILLEELSLTKLALECAHSRFDYAESEDLIDSSIYELNAAQKKYKYILNELKSLSKTADTLK